MKYEISPALMTTSSSYAKDTHPSMLIINYNLTVKENLLSTTKQFNQLKGENCFWGTNKYNQG